MSTENQTTSLATLLSMLAVPEIKDTWFNGKEVKLDGYKFIGCRFDNCKLTISSSNFEIINCFIDASTAVYYSGDIVKPVRLYNLRTDWVYANSPFFAPTKNADGTITIKA